MIPGVTEEALNDAKALFGFTATFLASRYDDPKPIPPLHIEMWSLCFSAHPQVSIAAPRGHAKSTAITFAYVLFKLLFKRSSHILILGSNEALASAFVNDIKIELRENDAIRDFFGIDRFIREKETELVVKMKDGHQFRVICKGAGQRMRGLKWDRKRPDEVVFDDMEDEETVMSETRRDKFRRWFMGAVSPIMKSGGLIRGVGTIMGFDSFLEGTMPPEKSPQTVHEPLRTYSTDTHRPWLSVKYRAHTDDFTSVLWPEQYPVEYFQLKRKQFAEIGMLDIYGQEYLNNPIDETTSYYRKTDFRPMKEGMEKLRMTYYVGCDLAIGEGKRSAYSVFVVGGLTDEGDLCIVDVRRGRWDGLQIAEELFAVNSRWNPDIIRIEEENIARSIGSFLYKMMDERQVYLPINTATPTKDKDKRSRAMQSRARSGKVYVDMEADWAADFIEELIRFPKHPYVDQFDAFGWLGLMLEEMIQPLSNAEYEDEQYEAMFEEQHEDGRDYMTGY